MNDIKNEQTLTRIMKECFWDYNMNESEILESITGDDEYKKRFLFEKILINSSKLFCDLSLFKKEDLQTLLNSYKVPSFNDDYIRRRKNLVEVYFLNMPLSVKELVWQI